MRVPRHKSLSYSAQANFVTFGVCMEYSLHLTHLEIKSAAENI